MAVVVQTGTAQIAAASTSTTITRGVTSGFATAAPPTRTVLWFSLSGGNNQPNNNYVRAVKTSEDVVTFQRAGTSGAIDIRWYLMTFDVGEAVVQDVAVTMTGATTTAAISAPSLGSPRFIVHLGSQWTGSGNVNTDESGRFAFDSDTQLSYHCTAGSSGDFLTAGGQVVEILGASVQTIQRTESATTATTLDNTITAVDRTRSIVIGGVQCPSGGTYTACAWDAYFTTDTNVRFERNTGTAGDYTFTVFVVTFPSGSVAQSVQVTGTGQTFNGTISAVTQADTVVIASGLLTSFNLLGSGRTATVDYQFFPGRNRFRTTTTSTTNAQAVRGGSDTDSQSITFQAFSVVAAAGGGPAPAALRAYRRTQLLMEP